MARVKWAVSTAQARAPWECKCLVRAIAGKRMLAFRRVSSTLYLGVARNEESEERGLALRAHAWLRCGDVILLGRRVADQFTAVSMFS